VLSSAVGGAQAVWQVGVLRAGAWAARGLRVPARNALLADVVAPAAYGRAYGFERAMDNLGAVGGPLLALGLVSAVGVRTAIGLSVIPGLGASLAILYAIRHTPRPEVHDRVPIRLRVRPVLRGDLGRLRFPAPRRHPEHRQPRGKRYRRPSLDRGVAARRVRLPRRVDWSSPRRPAAGETAAGD